MLQQDHAYLHVVHCEDLLKLRNDKLRECGDGEQSRYQFIYKIKERQGGIEKIIAKLKATLFTTLWV